MSHSDNVSRSSRVSDSGPIEDDFNLMDEYHKLVEHSISQIVGSDKKLHDLLRRAMVGDTAKKQEASANFKKMTIQGLSMALTNTTDSAFELLCRQELKWFTKYTEISRRCQMEFERTGAQYKQEHEQNEVRWRRESETIRERSKQALEKVAELEARIRSKGLDLPPAVTLPSEEGGDSTTQAARWNEDESESDDELGERGMFENSWPRSPVRTAAESAQAAVFEPAGTARDADGQHHTESAGAEVEAQTTENGSSSHEGVVDGVVSDVPHVGDSTANHAEEEKAISHTEKEANEPRQDTEEVVAEVNLPTSASAEVPLQSGSLDSPARAPRLSTHSQHSYKSTGSSPRRASSRNASLTAAADAVNGMGRSSPQPRQHGDEELEGGSAVFEDVSLP